MTLIKTQEGEYIYIVDHISLLDKPPMSKEKQTLIKELSEKFKSRINDNKQTGGRPNNDLPT